MATQAAVLTEIRNRLAEVTASFFTDAMLRAWINEGANDLVRRTETLQTRTVIDVDSGTREYTAPTDVIRINRVEWYADNETQKYALEYRDWQNMDAIWYTQQAVTTARPVYWTAWGFPPSLKIVLYPVPYTDGNIEVFYYRLPTQLATDGSAAGSTVEVPQGWENCVADYAEYMALRRDRDQRWQESKGLYEEHVAELFDLSRRWTDQAGQVVPSMPMGPWWLYSDGPF